MPYIQNISKKAIMEGVHMPLDKFTCDLIQISGAATFAPKAKFENKFNRIIHLDFEDSSLEEEGAANDEQAQQIVRFLKESKALNHNVVVHCFMGISRSGAVVEFAVNQLGFEAFPAYREPNQYLLDKLMTFKNI